MTVKLIGVGADKDHVRPVPTIDEDGRFEYIPIPETWETSEPLSYGTYPLRHNEAVASDFVDRIRPTGKGGEWIRDPAEIAQYPVHYDPNFDALTFGDKRNRGTGSTLASLDSGDVLGFYTGLRNGSDILNRHIFGFFVVEAVTDLSKIADRDQYHAELAAHPENAHAKRLAGHGERPKHYDVVIVDGRDPGGLLKQPYQISKRLDSAPWYRLTESFVDEFNVEEGSIAVSIKHPLTLDLPTDDFIQKVGQSI